MIQYGIRISMICLRRIVKVEKIQKKFFLSNLFHPGFMYQDFFITNLTSDGDFQLQIPVDRWKSLTTENICYAIGLMTNHQFVEISKIELNVDRNGFRHNSSTIGNNK